jgi:hypothetical protein
MNSVIFLMIAIAFVLAAFLSVVATLSAPPRVSRMANVVIYGCCVGALVSVMLAAWFFFWPAA